MIKKRIAIQCPCLYTRKGIEDILLDTQFSETCKVVASISNLDLYESRLQMLPVVDVIIVTLSSAIDDPVLTLRFFGEFLPSAHPNARILLIDDVVSTGVIARYISKNNGLWAVLEPSKALSRIKNQLLHVIDIFTGDYIPSKEKKRFLSQRETTVLRLLLDEVNTKDIAIHLKISPKTVSHHKISALKKLGIRTLQPFLVVNDYKKSTNRGIERALARKSIKKISSPSLLCNYMYFSESCILNDGLLKFILTNQKLTF